MSANPSIAFYRDRAGRWRFRVRAENGEVVCASQGYSRRKDAEHGAGALARALLWLRARDLIERHPE